MAPSVLGIGIPAANPYTPEDKQEPLRKVLDKMESDMQSSPYDWEMLYILPDTPPEVLLNKLREKKWDVVLVGLGLRTIIALTTFFESIVNAVHEELPNTKFAFSASIDGTQDAVRRIMAP